MNLLDEIVESAFMPGMESGELKSVALLVMSHAFDIKIRRKRNKIEQTNFIAFLIGESGSGKKFLLDNIKFYFPHFHSFSGTSGKGVIRNIVGRQASRTRDSSESHPHAMQYISDGGGEMRKIVEGKAGRDDVFNVVCNLYDDNFILGSDYESEGLAIPDMENVKASFMYDATNDDFINVFNAAGSMTGTIYRSIFINILGRYAERRPGDVYDVDSPEDDDNPELRQELEKWMGRKFVILIDPTGRDFLNELHRLSIPRVLKNKEVASFMARFIQNIARLGATMAVNRYISENPDASVIENEGNEFLVKCTESDMDFPYAVLNHSIEKILAHARYTSEDKHFSRVANAIRRLCDRSDSGVITVSDLTRNTKINKRDLQLVIGTLEDGRYITVHENRITWVDDVLDEIETDHHRSEDE